MTSTTRSPLRRGIVAALQLAPLVGAAATAVAYAPHLPPEIASHWSGFGGEPDGYTSTVLSFWTTAGIGLLLTIVAVALTLRGDDSREVRKGVAALTLVAGFPSIAWVILANTAIDAATPQTADLGAWLSLFVIPFLLGTAAFALYPVSPDAATDTGPRSATSDGSASAGVPSPLRRLGPSERLVWSRTITSPVLLAIAVMIFALALVTGIAAATADDGGLWVACATFGIAALSVLVLSPARLTIDRFGVRLRSGTFGIPLIRVPLDDIDVVSAEVIDPAQWGGWGYRIGGHGRAYVMKKGPGVVVRRTGGSIIAVTVTDPDEAAAAANALRERSRTE